MLSAIQEVTENKEEHEKLARDIKMLAEILEKERRRIGDSSCSDALRKLNE
jgi:hypothetical protein